MNREVEVKILLTAAQFRAVSDYAQAAGGQTAVHTNHYYDTPDEGLRQKGLTLRVRTQEDGAVLTLKAKEAKWQTGAASLEYHFEIADAPETLAVSDFPALTEQLQKRLAEVPKTLPRLGSLTTERTRFAVPVHDLTVELDKSRYFDQTDFELECELHDRAEESAFLAFLQETFGIAPTEPVCGKYHRFLNRLHEIGKR